MNGKYIEGLESLPASVRGCVLTIGNFDGVHLGHQRLLHTARSLADQTGSPAVAMTFEPPPELVLHPDSMPRKITPRSDKLSLLLEAGMDHVIIVTADKDFLATTPREFIEDVLVARLAPKHIVEGMSFFFGRGRSGSVETLREAAGDAGFEVHVIEPVMLELPDGQQRVSSTLIRSLIEQGHIAQASQCMGRPYAMTGLVVRGMGRGQELLGFPTVNLNTRQQVVPGDGVYAGKAEAIGKRYAAAISVGIRPTFGGSERCVEAFLLDVREDFYAKEVTLQFIQRIGDQQKYETAAELRGQIIEDVKRVQDIIG